VFPLPLPPAEAAAATPVLSPELSPKSSISLATDGEIASNTSPVKTFRLFHISTTFRILA
jgi:hypothetical protein